MFGLDKKQRIKTAWDNFLNGIYMDENYIRKEILDSWIRSKNNNVSYDAANKSILTKSELKKRIEERREFYDIATPIIESLYEFTKGASFMTILSDEEGYVLKTLGDEDIKAITDENRLIEGCNRSEERLGTNAIGTCLYLKKPIQIWADEHYYIYHRDKTCSGAPIFDHKGKLIGSICLTGMYEKAHFHTLGMVISAAESISKQLGLTVAYNEMVDVKNRLNVIIETIPSGVIMVDKNKYITQINRRTSSLLMIEENNIIGKKITDYIKKDELDLDKLKNNIYDTDVNIETNGINRNFSLSAVLTDKNHPENSEIVITFRKTESVHKMVNKIVGSVAPFNFDDIVGNSQEITEAKRLAEIASETNATVLLRGESGTGKELFAQAIHNMSSYKDGPFVAINCGSLPRTLIESELFGYVSGSFTGAKKEGQAGKFELANGGTIFLDEIGDMPADVQVSLLRVLQNREVTRLGGTKAIKINVRIIAATNKDLESAIIDNTFRSDLYYRLNVFSIKIPPLRNREGDVKTLSDYFLQKYQPYSNKEITGISPEVYNALNRYDWPGNIRELENTIERAILLSQGKTLKISDLPDNIRLLSIDYKDNKKEVTVKTELNQEEINYLTNINTGETMSISEMEKNAIITALHSTKGNIKKTADLLSMNRRTLYRKLDKYNIDYDSIRQ